MPWPGLEVNYGSISRPKTTSWF